MAKASSLKSLRELGRALGVSHVAARKWTRHDEWPWSRKAPWAARLVPEMKAWALRTLRQDDTTDHDPLSELALSAMQEAKVRLLVTRQAKLELERSILAGEYLDAAAVRRDQAAKVLAVKDGLGQLCRRMEPVIGADGITRLRAEVQALLEAFSGDGSHG